MDVNLNSSIVASFLVVVFVTCTVKLMNWAWFRPKKLEKLFRDQGLSGNPYRLLVGDVIDFVSVMKAEQLRAIQFSDNLSFHIMPYFKQIIEKYGKNSFIWLGSSPALLVTDPVMMKEILLRADTFQKPSGDPLAETVAGGLAFLEGDKWALHRKIINPSFRVENLKNMTSSIRISCSNMIDKWESLISRGGESNIIDVWPYMYDLSGDIISRTAFGSTHEQGRTIFELQKEQTKLVLEYLPYYYVPGLRYFPTKASRRIKANCKEIKSILRSMICERQKLIEKGGETTSNDLLGMLLESNYKEIQEQQGNQNKGMSVDDVIEECKLFYVAGSETISSLLVWAMVMLSQHQEWQSRAREEVLRIYGKNEPTFDGLNHLKVVTMIIQEVLRLYPSAPMTIRVPIRTTKVGKLSLPVGTQLSLLICLLHHDPEIWGDDAGDFKPERFSEGPSSAARAPSSFLPFGSGPHACIGQQFAMMEAKIGLAMILQRFAFDLSPSYQHAPYMIMTIQPKYGAPLVFHKI